MQPIRIGIIGFGGSGTAHFAYYRRIPGCTVTKIFDPKEAGQKRARETGRGAEVYGTLDGFWKDLDAVSVCTPDKTHADYMVLALENGVHAITEKPLTDSFEGVRRVKLAEKKSGRVAAVLHQMRFVPMNQKIHALLQKKALGDISYLEGYYVHDLRKRSSQNDMWRFTDNATPMLYCGSHFIDIVRWFANDEIVEVYAAANHIAFPEYPESDMNLVTLKFKSGIVGKVLIVMGGPCHQDHSVRIYGKDGIIENNLLFKNHEGWEVIHSPILLQKEHLQNMSGLGALKEKWRLFKNNFKFWLMGKTFEVMSSVLNIRRDSEYSARFYPVRLYEHSAACIAALEDFITAIRTGRRPLCTIDEAAQTVLAGLAGIESYRTGKPVKVKTLEEVL